MKISEYNYKMEPDGNRYAVLVNKANPVPPDWLETVSLVEYENEDGIRIPLEEKCAEAFTALKREISGTERDVILCSGYRSPEHQARLYAERPHADALVARPGYSEHNTGLAIDISAKVNGVWMEEDTEECFAIYRQLHERFAAFGFILRYPEGKEAITGYVHEPWHFRYVGPALAQYMYENQLTLEEVWA